MMKLKFRSKLLLSLAVLAFPLAVGAQEYPDGPMKLVVPYPPGSTPDALARIVSDRLSETIKQTVIVENRPGAGGMIGAKMVSDAKPDGRTLLMYTPAWPAAKIFMKNPPVSVPDGLTPVTIVAEGRAAFTAAGALPANTFNEMIEYAKANPGKLNFATTGLGDSYLYFHEIQSKKGVSITAIPYKGSAEYFPAMIANDIQMAFTPEYSTKSFVDAGKLKVLAVTGSVRSKAYPDAPTFAELGLPSIRNSWFGLFAPRGTSDTLIKKLNADLVAAVKSEQVGERIRNIFFDPVGSSAEEMRERIDTEIREWSELAQKVGIQPQ